MAIARTKSRREGEGERVRVEEEERERRHTSIRHKLDLISVYNHGPGPPVDQTTALHS